MPAPAQPQAQNPAANPAAPAGKPSDAAVEATAKAIAAPPANPEAPAKPVELHSDAPAAAAPANPAAAANKAAPALSIAFKSTETSVPLSVKSDLDAIVKQMAANASQRLTLIAYASSIDGESSMARRVALSRALSVRASLIDSGVSNMRINVQAEGDKNPGGDPDRVDLFLQ